MTDTQAPATVATVRGRGHQREGLMTWPTVSLASSNRCCGYCFALRGATGHPPHTLWRRHRTHGWCLSRAFPCCGVRTSGLSAPAPGLRLLPWETDTGKPCFLSTNGGSGALSRIADEIETDQLRDAADVLKGAQAVLDDGKAGEYALRLALRATRQCLGDVLRIADSRGARLPRPDNAEDCDDGDQDDLADGPPLPAEAFG
jgi:hypothetical protein